MDDDLPAAHFGLGWLEVFAVLGAILLVVLGLVLWVIYFRKTKRRRRKYREHRGSYREKLEKSASDIKEYVDKRHRRRGHGHHHQNPTLAETGGLPPRRSPDDQSSPDAT